MGVYQKTLELIFIIERGYLLCPVYHREQQALQREAHRGASEQEYQPDHRSFGHDLHDHTGGNDSADDHGLSAWIHNDGQAPDA